jgi:hypothetical protein
MTKTLCAGVFALAMIALLPTIPAASASELTYGGAPQGQQTIDIGYIHGALRLTAQQEPYWAPVEAALRALARHQAQSEPAGLVRRIGRRVVSVVLDSAAVERLVFAARPLIAVMSDEQKRTASGMAQAMGLPPVLAAMN